MGLRERQAGPGGWRWGELQFCVSIRPVWARERDMEKERDSQTERDTGMEDRDRHKQTEEDRD